MFDISPYTKELFSICESLQVSKLYLFGSALTGYFDVKSSDLDFLVEIDEKDPLQKGDLLLQLWENLELIFGRQVDLLTPESIKNYLLLQQIDSTKKLLYD